MTVAPKPATLDLLIAVRRLLKDADIVKAEYDRLIETAQDWSDKNSPLQPAAERAVLA
jgi:hypothetical protein